MNPYVENLTAIRTLDVRHAGQVIASGSRLLTGYHFFNKSASIIYLKFYNTSSTPTSSDTPVFTIGVSATNPCGFVLPGPLQFSLGIGLRATTGIADNDTTDLSANDLHGVVFCKS
jgi:hypothetical protein